MLRDAGTPDRTSPGTAAAFGCKCQCKGCLLLLQVTAAHTGVGKGHLKLDLNLVSQWLAETSSSQGWVVHPLQHSPNHTPSPFTSSITFTHKKIQFKGQNWGSKTPLHIKQFLLLLKLSICRGVLKCRLQQKALVRSCLPAPSEWAHPH